MGSEAYRDAPAPAECHLGIRVFGIGCRPKLRRRKNSAEEVEKDAEGTQNTTEGFRADSPPPPSSLLIAGGEFSPRGGTVSLEEAVGGPLGRRRPPCRGTTGDIVSDPSVGSCAVGHRFGGQRTTDTKGDVCLREKKRQRAGFSGKLK